MSDTQKKLIFIVEDEQEIRETLLMTFECLGYETAGAADGEKAIVAITDLCHYNGRTPDLILTDVVMPELDGIEMATQLARNTATMGIPIIFMSGELKDHCIDELGIFGGRLVKKPFDFKELKSLIAETLGVSEPAVLAEVAS